MHDASHEPEIPSSTHPTRRLPTSGSPSLLAPNPALPLTVTKSDLKVDSSEGTLLFDREAGNVVKNDIKATISGSMTLSIGGQALPADLKLSLTRSTSVGPAAE